MNFTVFSLLMGLACVSAFKEPTTFCGRALANARLAVCYGIEYVDKRIASNSVFDNFEDMEWEGTWPYAGRRGALSADWTRYKRAGIVDECCYKPCTKETLKQYC